MAWVILISQGSARRTSAQAWQNGPLYRGLRHVGRTHVHAEQYARRAVVVTTCFAGQGARIPRRPSRFVQTPLPHSPAQSQEACRSNGVDGFVRAVGQRHASSTVEAAASGGGGDASLWLLPAATAAASPCVSARADLTCSCANGRCSGHQSNRFMTPPHASLGHRATISARGLGRERAPRPCQCGGGGMAPCHGGGAPSRSA